MARPLRLEYEGAVYHVTSRGNARQDIYLVDPDRELFLSVLGNTVERFSWLCHAYCQMSNHYHLLIETPEANLSRGMRHLNGVYTQAFNRRHMRSGHILQGRFKAIVVEKESHLLELARYVVLNPVRARMVRSAKQNEAKIAAERDRMAEWLATYHKSAKDFYDEEEKNKRKTE